MRVKKKMKEAAKVLLAIFLKQKKLKHLGRHDWAEETYDRFFGRVRAMEEGDFVRRIP